MDTTPIPSKAETADWASFDRHRPFCLPLEYPLSDLMTSTATYSLHTFIEQAAEMRESEGKENETVLSIEFSHSTPLHEPISLPQRDEMEYTDASSYYRRKYQTISKQ